MHTYSVADAKAHLSQLIELVESGEEIAITKRGKAVARLVATAPARQSLPSLAQLRMRLPRQKQAADDFIRKLRDGDRF